MEKVIGAKQKSNVWKIDIALPELPQIYLNLWEIY
jgi:hypothetical protein